MKENYSLKKRNKIRVLIISDRLFLQAKEMARYLSNSGDVEVIGLAENMPQALNIAEDYSFDFLIIVGYLKFEYNYRVIAELQKRQKRFQPVQWAILDELICIFCQRYKIPLTFERTRPMLDFIDFLDEHRNE